MYVGEHTMYTDIVFNNNSIEQLQIYILMVIYYWYILLVITKATSKKQAQKYIIK